MATKGATERKEIEVKQPVAIEFGRALEIFDDLWRNIATRAYQFFEGRGRKDGHDLDDWLAAERELFSPIPIDVVEKNNRLVVRAEVPGFTKDELKVYVEPRRILIKGETEHTEEQKTEKMVYSERQAKQISRSLGLPSDVDANTASATLSNGVLEVTLTKTESPEPSETDVKIR